MEPRFNLLDSATAAKLVKRFYNAALALDQSTLPTALRQLVDLRVSQINGCAFCTDLHAKEAAASPRAGSTWSPPGASPPCPPMPSGQHWHPQRREPGSATRTAACPTRLDRGAQALRR